MASSKGKVMARGDKMGKPGDGGHGRKKMTSAPKDTKDPFTKKMPTKLGKKKKK